MTDSVPRTPGIFPRYRTSAGICALDAVDYERLERLPWQSYTETAFSVQQRIAPALRLRGADSDGR
jgi:hypothetical protein